MKIGILALQGDVSEHVFATNQAAKSLNLVCEIVLVRTKQDLDAVGGLDGLIIPGGESTVLQKLCEREGIFDRIKKIKNIFGTCAGAIFLAKTVNNKESDQRTLELMDIEIDRNGYGSQIHSFQDKVTCVFGTIDGIFIRAPRIKKINKKSVRPLGVRNHKSGDELVACEQRDRSCFYLACCFHPELTTTKFHEYFINSIVK